MINTFFNDDFTNKIHDIILLIRKGGFKVENNVKKINKSS